MFKVLSLLFFSANAFASANAIPSAATMDIASVLKSESIKPRWNELLSLENGMSMTGFTAASGAVAGALAGLKQDMVSGAGAGNTELGVELTLPGGMDPVYTAAAGAALGGLIGASHFALVDAALSDQLNTDPHGPTRLRMHLFQLVPRLESHGAALAMNASF